MSKRILYIGNKLSKKGITVTSIETLGRFLSAEGYTVHTASSVKNKPLRFLDMLWTTFRLSKKIDIVLIDTYSTQNFLFAVWVAKLCGLLKVPYVPILRGGDLPKRLKTHTKMSQRLFNGAKINVAPSHYLYEAFSKAGYHNLVFIPNTIEMEKYTFLKRNQPGPKLLWVRSFAEIYNPLLALKVLKQLKANGLEASLCMIGPFKDKSIDSCRQYNDTHNLNVTFTGKLDKEAWIERSAAYDIFINTTNFDNTPVSVMEAMALGLPIISTDVGGMPFLIDHGTDGVLVPPNREEAFVTAIQSLIQSPEATVQMTEKARSKVAKFDWQHVKHSWHSLLND